MARDAIVTGALLVAFATFVTAHATLVVALATREPRWRAAVALVVPPLAPMWALRARMPVRCAAWVASAVAYVALRWLAG